MKLTKLLSFAVMSLGTLVLLSSCDKDDDIDYGPDILFKTEIDAYKVTFNNMTEGATAYHWDFGDGTTSTDKSPVHEYPDKGKYVPTLTITASNGKQYEGATVLRISKSSAVKIDDNSLADWDTVSLNSGTAGPAGGIFRKMKMD